MLVDQEIEKRWGQTRLRVFSVDCTLLLVWFWGIFLFHPLSVVLWRLSFLEMNSMWSLSAVDQLF
ncbi:hypothetical protein P4O66_021410 [Electrophorus voltai]|uniref:Uncharacterized protein n=1 Tax=Electrophorus voltai TaxID=2609070 RepID=A0AAD8ZPU7_9TELE|nr:hypothetical protein P4O66_021410 [Electrophorus voltai]